MAGKIHLPHPDFVCKWKEEKVIKWLRRVNLDDCIPAFEVRHIDGIKLLDLTEQKLFTYQDLKIKHRKQISKCVQECKSQASNAKRIAKTIKQRKGTHLDGIDSNGGYISGEDSDDWGSDFEDESDEEVKIDNRVSELNNNTIIQSTCNTSEQNTSSNSYQEKPSQLNLIPQPPDVPVITKSINGTLGKKAPPGHTNTIPRPPIKRPPSQPPPPPVTQVPSQNHEQEDYEIPIVSTTPSIRESCSQSSDCSFHSVASKDFAAETYEIIEPPEETYELVDAPTFTVMEKPVLPPRIPFSTGAGSPPPPPLPQKPRKLKENIFQERPEGVRTFSRPKPPKTDPEVELSQSPGSPSALGFIGTLMGRRPSNPYISSPKSENKLKDSNESSFSGNHSVVSSSDGLSSRSSSPDKDGSSSASFEVKKSSSLQNLLPRSSPLLLDETAQNMATRPLPPVPIVPEKKAGSLNKLPQEGLASHPWFHEIERQTAEEVVQNLKESGSFVVRPSKRAGVENPYSLTILHDDKLFHLNIRIRPDNTFALGKEKKVEKTFSTVADLIAFHQIDPILLTSRGEPAGKTILCKYPEKS